MFSNKFMLCCFQNNSRWRLSISNAEVGRIAEGRREGRGGVNEDEGGGKGG